MLYLAIDSDGCLCTDSLGALITAWPDASQRHQNSILFYRSAMN